MWVDTIRLWISCSLTYQSCSLSIHWQILNTLPLLLMANNKAHFDGQIFPYLVSEFSFKIAPVSFWNVLIFFYHFLIFGTMCSRFILFFLWPFLESSTFIMSSGSFQWRLVFRSKELSAQCAHCYWSTIASGPSQPIENDRVKKYIHISISKSFYEYILKKISSYFYLQFQSNTAWFFLYL